MPDHDPGVLARELRGLINSREAMLSAEVCFVMHRAADYLESRAPVGVTVGEPALTGLEVTDEMVERAARALVEQRGLEPDGEYQEIKHWTYELGNARAALIAALQANGVSGSPPSPKQTSELEEAEAIGCGGIK